MEFNTTNNDDEEYNTDFESVTETDSIYEEETKNDAYLAECKYHNLEPIFEFLMALSNNSKVISLADRKEKINDQDLIPIATILQHNSAIYELDLSNNAITKAGAEHLALALSSNSTLEYLKLSANMLQSEGLHILSNALKQNMFSGLKKLDLENNDIDGSAKSAMAIVELLRSSKIQALNLKKNKIGDDGLVIISEGLKENNTLFHLNLDSNEIGDKGFSAFCASLKQNNLNTVLREIDFSVNRIGSNSGLEFANLIENSNRSLRNVSLKVNQLKDKGIKAILSALSKNNCRIEDISLGFNNASLEGSVPAMIEMVKENITLKKLEFQSVLLDGDACRGLSDAIKTNQTLTQLIIDVDGNDLESEEVLNEAQKANRNLKIIMDGKNSESIDRAIETGVNKNKFMSMVEKIPQRHNTSEPSLANSQSPQNSRPDSRSSNMQRGRGTPTQLSKAELQQPISTSTILMPDPIPTTAPISSKKDTKEKEDAEFLKLIDDEIETEERMHEDADDEEEEDEGENSENEEIQEADDEEDQEDQEIAGINAQKQQLLQQQEELKRISSRPNSAIQNLRIGSSSFSPKPTLGSTTASSEFLLAQQAAQSQMLQKKENSEISALQKQILELTKKLAEIELKNEEKIQHNFELLDERFKTVEDNATKKFGTFNGRINKVVSDFSSKISSKQDSLSSFYPEDITHRLEQLEKKTFENDKNLPADKIEHFLKKLNFFEQTVENLQKQKLNVVPFENKLIETKQQFSDMVQELSGKLEDIEKKAAKASNSSLSFEKQMKTLEQLPGIIDTLEELKERIEIDGQHQKETVDLMNDKLARFEKKQEKSVVLEKISAFQKQINGFGEKIEEAGSKNNSSFFDYNQRLQVIEQNMEKYGKDLSGITNSILVIKASLTSQDKKFETLQNDISNKNQQVSNNFSALESNLEKQKIALKETDTRREKLEGIVSKNEKEMSDFLTTLQSMKTSQFTTERKMEEFLADASFLKKNNSMFQIELEQSQKSKASIENKISAVSERIDEMEQKVSNVQNSASASNSSTNLSNFEKAQFKNSIDKIQELESKIEEIEVKHTFIISQLEKQNENSTKILRNINDELKANLSQNVNNLSAKIEKIEENLTQNLESEKDSHKHEIFEAVEEKIAKIDEKIEKVEKISQQIQRDAQNPQKRSATPQVPSENSQKVESRVEKLEKHLEKGLDIIEKRMENLEETIENLEKSNSIPQTTISQPANHKETENSSNSVSNLSEIEKKLEQHKKKISTIIKEVVNLKKRTNTQEEFIDSKIEEKFSATSSLLLNKSNMNNSTMRQSNLELAKSELDTKITQNSKNLEERLKQQIESVDVKYSSGISTLQKIVDEKLQQQSKIVAKMTEEARWIEEEGIRLRIEQEENVRKKIEVLREKIEKVERKNVSQEMTNSTSQKTEDSSKSPLTSSLNLSTKEDKIIKKIKSMDKKLKELDSSINNLRNEQSQLSSSFNNNQKSEKDNENENFVEMESPKKQEVEEKIPPKKVEVPNLNEEFEKKMDQIGKKNSNSNLLLNKKQNSQNNVITISNLDNNNLNNRYGNSNSNPNTNEKEKGKMSFLDALLKDQSLVNSPTFDDSSKIEDSFF